MKTISKHHIGFLINPIAGMGGKVGLKGTDGVVDQAIERGAQPTAYRKAAEMLRSLGERLSHSTHIALHWLTSSGQMGCDSLIESGFSNVGSVYQTSPQTSDRDTKAAVQCYLDHGAELIVFCGGDGTARDVCSVTQLNTPILGIPAGVKMYSGVFGISPARCADILFAFLQGELTLGQADIVDLDEDRYRRGEWNVRLYDSALIPVEKSYTQTAKVLINASGEDTNREAIAAYLSELISSEPDTLYLLGPGGTVAAVAASIGINKTLLGIDALCNGKLIKTDLNEQEILQLLPNFSSHRLVLSPIGAQGFILGRGNLPLSPQVIDTVGPDNVLIIATPEKLARTPVLRFDTGDPHLDAALVANGYLPVINGYRQRRMVKTAI